MDGVLIAVDRRLFFSPEEEKRLVFSDPDDFDECTSEARLKVAAVKITRHVFVFLEALLKIHGGRYAMSFDGSWIRAAVHL
jgi:hypothetical protein